MCYSLSFMIFFYNPIKLGSEKGGEGERRENLYLLLILKLSLSLFILTT